jgi:hypothetical protein
VAEALRSGRRCGLPRGLHGVAGRRTGTGHGPGDDRPVDDGAAGRAGQQPAEHDHHRVRSRLRPDGVTGDGRSRRRLPAI